MRCDTPMTFEEAKARLGIVDRQPIPMTNEEWFCGLSTEEKAEFLVKIELSAMHPVKRGAVDMEKFIEEVVDWLKQPHKE